MALAEFEVKNNINKKFYENLIKETLGVIKNIVKENCGEVNLNSELNIYTFKQVEQPIKKEEK